MAMEKAKQAHPDQQHRSAAAADRVGAKPLDAEFVDNRPEAAAQRKLAEAIDQSPQATAQRALSAEVHNSPYRVAQRKQLNGLFGVAAQLQPGGPEEELLQGKFATAQREEQPAVTPNHTGLPDSLKSGIESLSGMSMDHVKVHYNSSQPAQLNALAYAQGTDIHVASGQEQHLPHEAWHAVQQAQGRVKPTMQMKDGVQVNDDEELEHEADVMGAKALQMRSTEKSAFEFPVHDKTPIQRRVGFEFEIGNMSTTKTNAFGTRKKLNKADPLVTGAGYTIEADEETAVDPCYLNPSYPGYSDLEAVTGAFPVTVAGFGQLTAALAGIGDNINYVISHPNQNIAAGTLPDGVATANRFIRYNGADTRGVPQATVGLTLDALNTFFAEISPDAVGGAAPATAAQELFGNGLDAGHSFSLGGATNVTGLANIEAARTAALAEVAASLPVAQRTPEMVALVTQLIMYLNVGEVGASGYGKTIAGAFMMRTDFAESYRAIPVAGRVLTDADPTLFSLIVCRAARRVNGNVDDNGDLFSGGLYNHPKHGAAFGGFGADPKTNAEKGMLTGRLRRRDWLTGIANGMDLLTAQNFPTRFGRAGKQRAEIESLGSHGVNTDSIGLANLPILEFRGLPRVLPGLFTVMAMDIFRYVFALNTGGGGGNPGQLQALGLLARGGLANPADPNHAAERLHAINAATLAVAAWGGVSGGD